MIVLCLFIDFLFFLVCMVVCIWWVNFVMFLVSLCMCWLDDVYDSMWKLLVFLLFWCYL